MSINQLIWLMNTIPHITKPLKIKHVDVTSSISNEFHKENNKKETKFKADDYVTISSFKTNFSSVQAIILSEEVFVIKKVKTTVPWTCVLKDLHDNKIVGRFCEK